VIEPWREAGGDAWPRWRDGIEQFRRLAARLLGARPAAICPQTNVSGAFAKILHGLPERRGRNRIVLCEEDFPSLGFVVAAAARCGYEAVFLPRGAAAEDPAEWAAAFDGRTQLALITHAFSNRSARLPVDEITARARAHGIVAVVDVTQTAGVVPIDVADWSADFVIGSCVKFLCGGPGAGFLWVADEAMALAEPVDTGWFSHADPFEFDIHGYRPAGDARRYWGGTPSIAPFVQAAAALELLLGLGVARIQAHNQQLIASLHARVPAGVVRSAREPGRRGNVVLLGVRATAPAHAALRAAGIFADVRDGAIRVSPHLYNDADDLERLVGVLAEHFES
jgi:selenocysteine lyase/cysteine desulfurase